MRPNPMAVEEQNARVEAQYKREVAEAKKAGKGATKARIADERIKKDKETIYFLCAFGIFNIILLIIPLFGDSWLHSTFAGPGIGQADIKASLFQLHVDISCDKNLLEDLMCAKILEMNVNGDHSIHEFMQLTCSASLVSAIPCEALTKLWYTGWIILFFFGLSILAQLFSSVFLYYYWHVAPVPGIRKFAQICIFTCPFLILFGLAGFAMMAPKLDKLLAWGSIAGRSANESNGFLGFMSFRSYHPMAFGWCFVWSGFCWLSTTLSTVTMSCCFNKNGNERDLEDLQEMERERAIMEAMCIADGIDPDYYGTTGARMSTPSYAMQPAAPAGLQQRAPSTYGGKVAGGPAYGGDVYGGTRAPSTFGLPANQAQSPYQGYVQDDGYGGYAGQQPYQVQDAGYAAGPKEAFYAKNYGN